MTRFRCTAVADVERFGGDWCEVASAESLDWSRLGMTGLVEQFEAATGYTFAATFLPALRRGEYRAARALLWWSLLLAGRDDVPWATFEPRFDLVEFDKPGDGQGNEPSPEMSSRASRSSGRGKGRSTSTSPRMKSS